ncbi:MAG: M48 family metallopeptidase [Clostridia bacterium]|nr:M48 family metallopeptidase [Clostridia bacterium]
MEYEVIRSKRTTLSIEVNIDGRITVKAPLLCSDKEIEAFVTDHSEWIQKALVKSQKRREKKAEFIIPQDKENYYRQKAKEYLPVRTAYWSDIMGLTPAYVHITGAKKRFGSCNGKNGICFSFRLMPYPEKVIDYVIIHELAHIKHKNHSADFYAFIAEFMPDYRIYEKILKGD